MALTQGKQNFTLIDHTGHTISEVYVSPSKWNSWDEDVMDSCKTSETWATYE